MGTERRLLIALVQIAVLDAVLGRERASAGRLDQWYGTVPASYLTIHKLHIGGIEPEFLHHRLAQLQAGGVHPRGRVVGPKLAAGT